MKETTLKQRIRAGKLTRADVAKRLAELAYGEANDCTVLVLDPEADIRKLDLSLLSEVKRSEKGAVEVKLLDRLNVSVIEVSPIRRPRKTATAWRNSCGR